MTYAPRTYAEAFRKALAEAGEGEAPKLAERLVKIMEKNGDAPRAASIFEAIRNELVHSRGGRVIRLEFASAEAARRHAVPPFAQADDHVEIAVKPELIAGVRVTVDGERELDNSFAGRLRKVLA